MIHRDSRLIHEIHGRFTVDSRSRAGFTLDSRWIHACSRACWAHGDYGAPPTPRSSSPQHATETRRRIRNAPKEQLEHLHPPLWGLRVVEHPQQGHAHLGMGRSWSVVSGCDVLLLEREHSRSGSSAFFEEDTFSVSLSAVEIYLEAVRDLLLPKHRGEEKASERLTPNAPVEAFVGGQWRRGRIVSVNKGGAFFSTTADDGAPLIASHDQVTVDVAVEEEVKRVKVEATNNDADGVSGGAGGSGGSGSRSSEADLFREVVVRAASVEYSGWTEHSDAAVSAARST